MRHYKIMVLFLGSLLLICGCSNSGSDEQEKTLGTASEYGQLPDTFKDNETEFSVHSDKEIYLFPVTAIELVITDAGSNVIGFGEYRTLEKIQGDTWYAVPYREEFSFVDIGLGLEPGDHTVQEMPLEYLSYELSAGTYRIVKTFHIDGYVNEVVLAAQFEIK